MQDITIFIAQHTVLSLALIAIIILLLFIEFSRVRSKNFAITPAQLTLKINHDHAVIIDTRSPELYRQGHIIHAQAMTAEDIANHPKKLDKFKQRPLIIVSSTDAEAKKIAALLIKQGYNAYSLMGGMRSWGEAQMPIVRDNHD